MYQCSFVFLLMKHCRNFLSLLFLLLMLLSGLNASLVRLRFSVKLSSSLFPAPCDSRR